MELFRTMFSCGLRVLLGIGICLSLEGPVSAQDNMSTSLLTCYCNAGDSCDLNTHTCSNNYLLGCVAKVKQFDGNYSLLQYCAEKLIPCWEIDSVCCKVTLCNRCPNRTKLWATVSDLSLNTFNGLSYPNECNVSLVSTLPSHTQEVSPSGTTNVTIIASTTLSVILVVVIIVLIILSILYFHCRHKTSDVESIGPPPYYTHDRFGNITGSMGSGALGSSRSSKAGRKILNAKTLAQMITQKERIGKGAFGEVWRASWDERDVAVKVFHSIYRSNWQREADIYNTFMLSHPNILSFISREIYDNKYQIEFWLIFEFHHHGSLSSYLKNNTVSRSECLSILTSIAAGLCYLHLHILTSTQERKPIIAHKDLKTGNILVKGDMTCCIGDLGLAVTEFDFSMKKKPPNYKQGTNRYLAPEILDASINKRNIYSYVKADVYSFSLIMWEVARRSNWLEGEVSPYQIPLYLVVPDNPSLEDMKKVVVDDVRRPPLDTTWKSDKLLSVVSYTMQECWRADPEGRISSQKIKMNLQRVGDTLDKALSTIE